jgi:DNA-binding NtrC family response regulator
VYANLRGRDGIVASVSFDQSLRDARAQFERAYLQYHLSCTRTYGVRCARLETAIGVDLSQFYRRCRELGVSVKGKACAT